MCAQCLSQSDFVLANVALAAAIVKAPAHRALAAVGLVNQPLDVARDARTVEFLRGLALDPAEVLGADVVADADEWVALGGYEVLGAERRRRAAAAWARPIGSHSRLAVK